MGMLSFGTLTKHEYFKSRHRTILKVSACKSNKNDAMEETSQWEPSRNQTVCVGGWGFPLQNLKIRPGYLPEQFTLQGQNIS